MLLKCSYRPKHHCFRQGKKQVVRNYPGLKNLLVYRHKARDEKKLHDEKKEVILSFSDEEPRHEEVK